MTTGRINQVSRRFPKNSEKERHTNESLPIPTLIPEKRQNKHECCFLYKKTVKSFLKIARISFDFTVEHSFQC